ncbi:hypothetical protein BOTBODRAFT_105760 [Botryobasidium botryosum FD-172 SS1]|uniref:Uncharacterized protein n=1 Tax=Botryobasidium botryosum (strain FD-172 SS1) TaxID=930990 RepID=A0A067MRU2_BOTB1|nr:hypothetical protein BOTBODRAFT_105760 [Botryobasidium botryosum FD-172 SS1]
MILKLTRPNARVVVRRTRAISSSAITIGIRREDPARIWERRCPLTPDAVRELIRDHGVNVILQDCDRRIWTRDNFLKVGASFHPTLEPATIILGIKEVPLNELITSPSPEGLPRTHIMFSHTIKGQPYNMPLLTRFMSTKDSPTSARLIDYELLTDQAGPRGKRVVGFGWFAGAAGAVEGLAASALEYLSLGVATPFLHLPRPYSHFTLAQMRASLRSIAEKIGKNGMPRATGPYIIAVTGNGNVATGALDLLSELPVSYITAAELPELVANKDADLRKIYVLHVPPSAYLFRKDGGEFDRQTYYSQPAEFESRFHELIAPYISLLINGTGWNPGFPRLMTSEQCEIAVKTAGRIGKGRFRSVADVSCDVMGGLEFVTKATTIDEPFFKSREGVQVMSVDILPTQLPLDASCHFSNALMPYLRALVREYQGGSTGGKMKEEDAPLAEALERATIAKRGRLTEGHEWLYEQMEKMQRAEASSDVAVESTLKGSEHQPVGRVKKKTVLLFGSGMVAKPAVEEFLKRAEVKLVVASNNVPEAEALLRGCDRNRAEVVQVNSADAQKVGALVERADVVVSLLPAPLHPPLAEQCIQHGKHLVTASYISPTMQALNSKALAADVLLLNEIGLDPGIDHLSAMELRDRIEAQGKRVSSFISWCGGLPAPENSNVPLGMKFSWSPAGLLSAATNDAKFKLRNKMFEIPGQSLLSKYFPNVPIAKGFAFEGLANRDSLSYADTYGLGPLTALETVFRGTLRHYCIDRYQGFADVVDAMKKIGLFEREKTVVLKRWEDLAGLALEARGILGAGRGSADPRSIRSAFADVIPKKEQVEVITGALEWLSMIPKASAHQSALNNLPALPQGPTTPFALLAALLSHKLRYEAHERDMVVLTHEVIAVPASNPAANAIPAEQDRSQGQKEVYTSTLITYGTPTASAMSRTVGLPIAFAALRILDGDIRVRGVRAPVDEEVYRGVLHDLEGAGLGMRESMSLGGEGMGKELVRGLGKF